MEIIIFSSVLTLIGLVIVVIKLWLEQMSSKRNEQLLVEQTEATIKLYTALEDIAKSSEKTIESLEKDIQKCKKEIVNLKKKTNKNENKSKDIAEKKLALDKEKLEYKRRETDRKERNANMRNAKDLAKALGLLK